jgi:hypothetical protein
LSLGYSWPRARLASPQLHGLHLRDWGGWRESRATLRSSESAAYSKGEGDSRLMGAGAGADALEVCCEHTEGREWREVRKEFKL